MRSPWARLLLAVSCLCGLAGCAAESDLLFCKDAPLVTYANFGKAFIEHRCQGCHASGLTGKDRSGAPVEFAFDTVDDVWEHADIILLTSTGEAPIMPPSDGVFPEERARLEIWLRCTEEGN